MTDTPAPYTKAQRRLLTATAGLGVLALAAATFVLSYDDLRTLAVQGGAARRRAYLYPAMADGLVVIVILSIVTARRASWWYRALRWLLLLVLIAGAGAAGVQRAVHGYGGLSHAWLSGGVAAAPWVILVIAVWLWVSMIKLRLRARRRRPDTYTTPDALSPTGTAPAGPAVVDGDIVPGLGEEPGETRPLPRPAARALGPAQPAGDAARQETSEDAGRPPGERGAAPPLWDAADTRVDAGATRGGGADAGGGAGTAAQAGAGGDDAAGTGTAHGPDDFSGPDTDGTDGGHRPDESYDEDGGPGDSYDRDRGPGDSSGRDTLPDDSPGTDDDPSGTDPAPRAPQPLLEAEPRLGAGLARQADLAWRTEDEHDDETPDAGPEDEPITAGAATPRPDPAEPDPEPKATMDETPADPPGDDTEDDEPGLADTAPRMIARTSLPTDVRLVGPPVSGNLGDTQPDGFALPDTDPDGIPMPGPKARPYPGGRAEDAADVGSDADAERGGDGEADEDDRRRSGPGGPRPGRGEGAGSPPPSGKFRSSPTPPRD